MYWLGWEMGAVEAISLSILVGSSVDYCLHLVEGFLLAGETGSQAANHHVVRGPISRLPLPVQSLPLPAGSLLLLLSQFLQNTALR